MTKGILTGNALRDWDPAEMKAVYWSGACQALVQVMGLYGCKTRPIRGVLLPDSVIEHHPGGLKSLQAARRRWIADDFARKAGLLK